MSEGKPDEVYTSKIETVEAPANILDTIRTTDIEVDNYHGITGRTIAVYLAINLISVAGLINIIGAGAVCTTHLASSLRAQADLGRIIKYARYIAASLGGTSQEIWLSQVSAILVAILAPSIAQAADYWGRKWFLVVTTLVGFAGCMVVSRATSMHMAITGEVLAAFGYGSQALLNAIASEILPRRLRPAAQGGLGLTSGLGAAFSLLFGFHVVTTSSDGWRIYWYVTGALMLVAAVLFLIAYHPPLRALQRSLTTAAKLRRLDWVAYALLAVGIVCFNLALTWSNNPYSWSDGHVVAPFVIGVVSLLALVAHQLFIKRDGLCHHEVFKRNRNSALAFLLVFVEGLSFYAFTNFFPSEMAILYEPNIFRVGLRASVTFFAATASAFAVSIYSSATRDLRNPIIGAYSCIVIFNILMATATLDSTTAVWGYPVFLGLGLGIALSSVTTVAQFSASPALIAVASGLVAGVRAFGGSIALPIFSSIFNSTVSKHLASNLAAAVIPLGLSPMHLPQFAEALASQDQEALVKIPGVTPAIIAAGIKAVKSTYLLGYRYVWITSGVFTFLGVVAACFLHQPKKDMNMHVDAPLDDEK